MKAAYSRLLGEFPAVVYASKRLLPVSHDVVHHIVTHGPPIASKFRKLDGEKLAAAKAGGGRHYSALHISLVQPLTHGEEGGRDLAAVRGLQAAEPGY
jgi:hypothetical protein